MFYKILLVLSLVYLIRFLFLLPGWWIILIIAFIYLIKRADAQVKGSDAQWKRKWSSGGSRTGDDGNRSFLDGLSGMLAKIAKADGHVSPSEIQVVERFLMQLGLPPENVRRCKSIFRMAKDDDRPIEFYARRFAESASLDARRIAYQILWEVAAADGNVSVKEDLLLRRACASLYLTPELYRYFKRRYSASSYSSNEQGSGAGRRAAPADDLANAYRTLGCSPSDSDDAVRSAYRTLAKKYHPDKLRAEGVPDSVIEKATATMAEINNAWNLVRKARQMR